MSSKIKAFVKAGDDRIVYNDVEFASGEAGAEPTVFSALNSNIQESLDEIDILRGTVQYWESRPAATGSNERVMLTEAFRIMHGELLGLTARMKQLLDREELAAE